MDDLLESPEEVAAKFNGTCKRLPAGQAAYVYWKSGGLTLGLGAIFIFAFTQTTRIMGDWWIRCAAYNTQLLLRNILATSLRNLTRCYQLAASQMHSSL